ncbi:exopolyphosphatase [Amphritea japonica]|uniref:Exopolyphosphatase n=1 Tax=Amphritea japonica ATCC BAA-1530 TaxID=1278309 RepID=A0A7R6P8J4_9GAMM|nr:exopolyphosphatase [Amphritea japonica]BBB27834.1 exopolyphosphatase/guanosine-5'-triphosphate,3'-diphosphate pyrophosphatase [Amphritea japonica ATCC BAA-1530]
MNQETASFNPSESSLLAAIDLGSNSFHIVVAKLVQGELQPIDLLSDKVQLAAGLDENRMLTPEARQRGLDCLERFAQRVRDIPEQQIRIVGTNALREAVNSDEFIQDAEKLMGCSIEVIAGIEEARLIYLGVSHTLAGNHGRRLVIDIGGGSTEFVIGERFEPLELESLEMGCVSFNKRYFADGVISEKSFQLAVFGALRELLSIKRKYRQQGWEDCVGSSGTIKAVRNACIALGYSTDKITASALQQLKEKILSYNHVDEIDIEGLKEQRRAVFPAGIAILSAAFESLGIKEMSLSEGALREGLLYDMAGRLRHEDVRERSINAMIQRYHVDQEQAGRIEQTALIALTQVRDNWHLEDNEYHNMLSWAARCCECGLTIAHSQYHKHSAYLLLNSDLPGFTKRQQVQLAAMVRDHRRKFSLAGFEQMPARESKHFSRLTILLRLAFVLHRNRSRERLPAFYLSADKNELSLRFPDNWLSHQPLTQTDLEHEAAYLANAGFSLTFK